MSALYIPIAPHYPNAHWVGENVIMPFDLIKNPSSQTKHTHRKVGAQWKKARTTSAKLQNETTRSGKFRNKQTRYVSETVRHDT